MPSQGPPRAKNQYPIQWIHIDDFSPGCYDAGHISTLSPITSQPLGAGYLPNTYSCASIPGGALAPLPGIRTTVPFSTSGGIPGGAPYSVITGFSVTPVSQGHEVFSIAEADNGTLHYVGAVSYLNESTLAAIAGPTQTVPTQPGIFGSPYPAYTRVGPNLPPQPVLVFPSSPSVAVQHLWVYPNPNAPTVMQALDISGGNVIGQVVTYGNRIICLVGQPYQWPAGGGISVNEDLSYTDPPETTNYGNQLSVMAVEEPWGYGAWGTVSVGELIFIKKRGGAVILNGDINVPSSIIPVPGVQPTGMLVGRAAPTPIGLVYCSENEGAWVWNGGNTSHKISRNIRDNFFDLEKSGNIPSNNYGFNCAHWQKWLCFSNNIIMDTDTNGWWKLYPNSTQTSPLNSVGRDLWWYCAGEVGNKLYCAPLKITNSADPWYSIFDNTLPSTFYQWQSLPIHVTPSADRVIDIRQIVIRASDPLATGPSSSSLNVSILKQDGTVAWQQTNLTGITGNPTPIRLNVGAGAQGLSDITLSIAGLNRAGAGNSAPIIHSIDVGYVVRAGVSVSD